MIIIASKRFINVEVGSFSEMKVDFKGLCDTTFVTFRKEVWRREVWPVTSSKMAFLGLLLIQQIWFLYGILNGFYRMFLSSTNANINIFEITPKNVGEAMGNVAK